MDEPITRWIRTLQGKTRFELMYQSTDLMLPDGRIIAADVYDDYLIFNALDAEFNAKQLFMLEIEELNDRNPADVAMRIANLLN